MLLANASYSQTSENRDIAYSDETTTPSKKETAVAADEGYFLSLDTVAKTLYIPPSNDSLQLYGVKIFSEAGKELFSRRIEDTTKSTAIDISNLPEGDYIIHIVTVEQVIYRSKFAYRR